MRATHIHICTIIGPPQRLVRRAGAVATVSVSQPMERTVKRVRTIVDGQDLFAVGMEDRLRHAMIQCVAPQCLSLRLFSSTLVILPPFA